MALAGVPLAGRRLVVFGEMLELGADSAALHEALGREVQRAGIDMLIVIGAGAEPIAAGALAAGMPADAVHALPSAAAALELLRPELRAGDHLLCKASRRVGLDRLVDALLQDLTGSAPAPTEAG